MVLPQGTGSWHCVHRNGWDDFPKCKWNAPGVGWYLKNVNESDRYLTRAWPKSFLTMILCWNLKSYQWLFYVNESCLSMGYVPPPWGVAASKCQLHCWQHVVPSAMCISPGGSLGTTCVNSQSTQMQESFVFRRVISSHGFLPLSESCNVKEYDLMKSFL